MSPVQVTEKGLIVLMLLGIGTGCVQVDKPAASANIPDWENQHVIQKNRLPARATFVPYPDEATARHCNPEISPYRLSLNGG